MFSGCIACLRQSVRGQKWPSKNVPYRSTRAPTLDISIYSCSVVCPLEALKNTAASLESYNMQNWASDNL